MLQARPRGLGPYVLGAGLVIGVHEAWFRAFPQMPDFPPDQAGYLVGGRALLAAVPALLTGRWSDATVEGARRWFDFLGVASFYGVVDAMKPGDIDFFRRVLALLNAGTALAVCRLAAQLAGPRAAVAAAFLFLVSPAFPSGASRVYPDALTGALVCLGLSFLLIARTRGFAFAAGLLLGSSLLIRVQLVPWVPLLLLAVVLLASPWWMADPARRSRVLSSFAGFLVPCLLLAAASALALENNDYRAPKHNLPRYQAYALGVWQYLDTDGWDGPYRLKTEPFYQALSEASRAEPALLSSRLRQYRFALEYLWLRRSESVPLVLDNLFRIVSRPQNPEQRGFLGSAEWLVDLHRFAVLAAVAGGVVCLLRGGFFVLVPLLPLFVVTIHAFAFPWPRYFMPVLPVTLALSGAGIAHISSRAGLAREGAKALAILVALLLARLVVADTAPELARGLWLVALGWGGASFARLSAPPGPGLRERGLLALAFGAVAVVVVAHEWRSRSWHETTLSLADGDIVRQEIALDPGAVARLRALPERFLAVDMEVAAPSVDSWTLSINGRPAVLRPSIPPLPESIPFPEEGRMYPQWWIAGLPDEILDRIASEGRLRAEITVPASADLAIRADRFSAQDRVLEAPSFGEWPRAVGLKPEYDRDFRLVTRYVIEGGSTRSSIVRQGETRSLRAVARVRVLGLQDRTGRVVFNAEPSNAPAHAGPPVLGFAGRSGMRDRGEAVIRVNETRVLKFPVGVFAPYDRSSEGWQLCYRDSTPDRAEAFEARGLYYLRGPLGCSAGRCRVAIEFVPGLDDRPFFFSTETVAHQPGEEAHRAGMAACGFGPATPDWVFGALVDGTTNRYPEDRGRWTVAVVF